MTRNELLARLRTERLAKVQGAMAKRDIGVMVLTNPVNVRYTTGVSVMPIWTSINLARLAIVPVHGEPILHEYGKALFRAQEIWPKSRPIRSWQYRFAHSHAAEYARKFCDELKGLMAEWGVEKSRVAMDMMDFYGAQALLASGIAVTDSDEPLEEAQLVKTPDEIVLLRESGDVAAAALGALEQSIRPGITEQELMGVFWGKMISLGGEHCSTRLLVSGEKTNPWFHEAGARQVREGDLIGIDTDMAGPEGYLCDISRTFLCGDKATDTQREAFHVAYDFIQGAMEVCRPGVSYADALQSLPRYPKAYEELAYSCSIHGCGLDDEPPFFPFPHEKGAGMPDGEFKTNMVVSVEFYAGKKGEKDGVKLEEQILVTERGPELLARYPFDARLF